MVSHQEWDPKFWVSQCPGCFQMRVLGLHSRPAEASSVGREGPPQGAFAQHPRRLMFLGLWQLLPGARLGKHRWTQRPGFTGLAELR